MSASQNKTAAFSALYREITWIFVLYFIHRFAESLMLRGFFIQTRRV